MIVVNSSIMQKQIIKIVENISEYTYTFVKKEGIKLYFDVDTEDQETAAIVAKKAIKADPMSGTLIISVKVEK